MAQLAAERLHLKTVAIIDDRSAYGQGLADAFADSLKDVGIKVVAREFTSDKATDFSAILTKIVITSYSIHYTKLYECSMTFP